MIPNTLQAEPPGKQGPELHRKSGNSVRSPARFQTGLNLNDLIVKRPASTYFTRVNDHEWSCFGINQGDLLVIDRSLAARHNSFVIAAANGELQLCKLRNSNNCWCLELSNGVLIKLDDEKRRTAIRGVVSHIVHACV